MNKNEIIEYLNKCNIGKITNIVSKNNILNKKYLITSKYLDKEIYCINYYN